MKCPMCQSQNPDSSKFCNSCGGRFTGSGVEFSQPYPESESCADTPEAEMDEFLRSYGETWFYARMGLAPIALALTAILGAFATFEGYSKGDSQLLFVGLFMLAICVLFVVMLLYSIRKHPCILDDGGESASADGTEDLSYEMNRARLRR